MTKKKTILLDGDILVYQAASGAEKEINWGDGLWTLHAYEDEALGYFKDQLNYILETTKVMQCKIFLTGNRNYRKHLHKDYKANRSNKRKPMLIGWLKKYLLQNYDAIVHNGIEADDAIGVYSVNAGSVIVSKDKDLLTIAGEHWSPERGFFEVTQEEADHNFLMQTLTGDTTDNYKGCPSVGPVKARKILDTDDPWGAVVTAFNNAGLTEEEAITQARLARILRPNEFDIEKNEVKLWTPQTQLTNPAITQTVELSALTT